MKNAGSSDPRAKPSIHQRPSSPRTPSPAPSPSTPLAKANVGASADSQQALFKSMARRRRPTVDGKAKYRVLKAIIVALNTAGLPPLDERLKSITASQIGTLLKGGFPEELVKRIAVELALAWDVRRGHNRLAHLTARVRAIDGKERTDASDASKAEPIDPRVAAIIGRHRQGPQRPNPNAHAFQRSAVPNTCAVVGCGGPIGVHVRVVSLDDEGHATVIPSGDVR